MPRVDTRVVYKRGDTKPTFRAQCLDDATPVDLTGATAQLLIRAYGRDTRTVALQVAAGADGWVTHDWTADDLATPGVFRGEVDVTFNGGGRQTFPADGYITIEIIADLGP